MQACQSATTHSAIPLTKKFEKMEKSNSKKQKISKPKRRRPSLRETCIFELGTHPLGELYVLALQLETRFHLSCTQADLRKWFSKLHPDTPPKLHLLAFADVISRRYPDITFRDAALTLAKVRWL